VVCSITMSNPFRYVYTGGKGNLKIWDAVNPDAVLVHDLQCLKNTYIRSCKLTADSRTMIVAGETNVIAFWDLNAIPQLKGELQTDTEAIYALAVSPDGKHCYACCSDGKINIWDLHNKKCIQSFNGHAEGASCVEISSDQTKLYSGGLDQTVRVWDIAGGKEITKVTLPSQIFSLSVCPDEPLAVAGLESSQIEIVQLDESPKVRYEISRHQSCVLSVKYAPSKKWFVSTGKDGLLAAWTSPNGSQIFEHKESTSILCSDISSCGTYLVTGSGDRKATLYETLV